MKQLFKRVAGAALAGVLAVGALAGCGEAAAPAPTNADELYEKYAEVAATTENCHMDGAVDMVFSMSGFDVNMAIKSSMDAAGNYLHGTTTIKADQEGIDPIESEFYMVKSDNEVVTYTKGGGSAMSLLGLGADGTEAGETWTKGNTSMDALGDLSKPMSKEVFADAEFEATDAGYVVRPKGDKIADEIVNVFAQMNGTDLESADKEAIQSVKDTITKVLEGTTYELVFDKEYRLSEASIKGLDISSDTLASASGSEEDAAAAFPFEFKLSLDGTVTYSNYGGVDEASVKVPDDVASSAVDTSDLDVSSLLGGGEESAEAADSAAVTVSTAAAA